VKLKFLLTLSLWLPLFGDSHNQRFQYNQKPYQFESNHLTLIHTENLTLYETSEIENINTDFKDIYKLYGIIYQTYSYKPTSTFTFGYFDKAESFIKANKGFIRGTYIVSNTNDGLEIAPNRIFEVEANGLYYKTNGLYLEQKIDKFIVKLSAHNLKELQNITIDGYGYDDEQGIRTDIFIDYFYSTKNYILKNESFSKGRTLDGRGYSVDLGYEDRFENWIYGFGRENVASRVYVSNMPSLYAIFDNINNIYTTSDGYKNAHGLLKYFEYTYRDFSFEMPTTDYIFLENEKNYGIVGSNVENEIENIYLYYYLNKKLKLGYSDINKLFDFEYFGKNYSFCFSSNIDNINNSNGFNIGFSLKY
jgi:hypothetical protein